MAARKLRRPMRLSEMYPQSRIKEIVAMLGDDNEAVRSLKSLVQEEQLLTARGPGQRPNTREQQPGGDKPLPTPSWRRTAERPAADSGGDGEWDSGNDEDTATSRTPTPCHPTPSWRRTAERLAADSDGDGVWDPAKDGGAASSGDPSNADTADASQLPPFMLRDTLCTLPMNDDELLMPGQIPKYQPFPLEYLPAPIQQFVSQQAAALNCAAATVVLPVLSTLASAIGGQQRIQLKRGWSEPAILWTAVVREGMASHDPILEAAITPLRQRQARAFEQQQPLLRKHRQQLAAFRRKQRCYPDGSDPPVEPLAERTMTVDWTLPTLSRLLTQQARGLLICPLELDGWLGKSTGNGMRAAVDRQAWFDLHAGRSVMMEGRTPVSLSAASVSMTGTLSAEVLSRRLTKSNVACGLTGRLLFASAPARFLCWKDEEVDQATLDGYAAVVEQLFSLSGPDEVVSGASAAECVTLSPEARDSFDQFVTELGSQQPQIDDALSAWVSNLPSQAARLALVLHQTRWAAGEAVDRNVCDHRSMQCGIAVARWFAYEAQRVLKRLSLTAERRDLQQLYEWIQRQGELVGPREVCRYNSRKYPTGELALIALGHLQRAGVTRWLEVPSGPKGGRPTRKMEVIRSDERKGTSNEGEEGLCRARSQHDVTRDTEEMTVQDDRGSSRIEPVSKAPSYNGGAATEVRVSCQT